VGVLRPLPRKPFAYDIAEHTVEEGAGHRAPAVHLERYNQGLEARRGHAGFDQAATPE
jgi:hypothetical protein